jgi:hypothetical protein
MNGARGYSEPSARPMLTSAPSADRVTRTSQGLQQTSQSCTKLPRTSSSMWISTSSPQYGHVTRWASTDPS